MNAVEVTFRAIHSAEGLVAVADRTISPRRSVVCVKANNSFKLDSRERAGVPLFNGALVAVIAAFMCDMAMHKSSVIDYSGMRKLCSSDRAWPLMGRWTARQWMFVRIIFSINPYGLRLSHAFSCEMDQLLRGLGTPKVATQHFHHCLVYNMFYSCKAF